jgi:hypothetical protein
MMNLDELPIGLVREGVQQIIAARGVPTKGMTPDGLVAGLRRATRGWSQGELTAAIDAAIATETYWPGIPAVVKARPPRMTMAGPEMDAGPDVCRSCGSHYHYRGFLWADNQVRGRLRCDCPQMSDRWDGAAALAWSENDPKLVGTAWFRDGLDREEWAA